MVKGALRIACGVLLLAACADEEAQQPRDPGTPPNVVIILTDDMGYGDLSSHGHPLIRTPNIDVLAAGGLRWTSFYASSPLCNQSRVALMTGRMPIRINGGGLNQWSNLPSSELTLGQLLKDAGYATAYIGKWGISGRFENGGVHPNDAGFDYFYGVEDFNDGGRRSDLAATYENIKNSVSEDYSFSLFRQREAIENPTHQPTLTKRYTEESVAWLRQREPETPFFLYLGHTMPHVPIFSSPEFEGRSKAGRYGDVIEELDWSVGQVIAALEEMGAVERTLVVFSSDNGPWLTYYDMGGSPGPFRDGKHTAWEGGFRVPGIFSWPGTVAPGVVDGIGVQVDLMATVAGLTGVSLPADRDYDSMDLSGTLLRGEPSPRDRWFYYATRGALWAARLGDHKLVLESWDSVAKEGEPSEWRGFDNHVVHEPPLLFDLSTDLAERHDVAASHPDVVARIEHAIREYHAGMPE
jgi:arylsulfatase A-like enzyme